MNILAISGWKRSGKDSCADYLVKNEAFTRISFADPLKDSVALEYGIQRELLDDPIEKERPLLDFPVSSKDEFTKMIHNFMIREFRTAGRNKPDPSHTIRTKDGGLETFLFDEWEQLYQTPRSLAILKGSINRSVKSDFWVQKAIKNIKNGNDKNYVISDLRYQSEMEQLKEAFGKSLTTIRIERFDKNPSTDPSETDLDNSKFDHTIQNKSSKEELFNQLNDIVFQLNTN